MPLYIVISTQVAIADYPVKIDLSQAPSSFWNNVIDGTDIYFLDSNGNPLYYFIEYIDKTNKKGIAWVKITLSANSSTIIQMFFGGLNPYSSYNDPYKVFLFFEDFENTRDPNWVDGTYTPGQYEYATPSLRTGNYRLHFKTGRSATAWYNMWWKGRTFDNFRLIAYVRADYSDDDSAVLFRSTGSEAGSNYDAVGYRVGIPRSDYKYFAIIKIDSNGKVTPLATLSATNTSDTVRLEIMVYGSKINVIVERPPGTYLGNLSANDSTYSSGYIGLGAPGWNSNRNPSFDTFAIANYVDPEPTVSIYESIPSYQLEDQDYILVSAPSYQLEDQDYLLISAPSYQLEDQDYILVSGAVYQLEDQDYISVSGVMYQLEDQDYISISAVSYKLEDQDYISISPPPPPPPTPACLEFQDILSQEGYSWDKAIASLLCGLEAVLTELGNEISRSAKIISLVFIGIGFGYALMKIGEKIIMLVLKGLRKSYEKKR